MASKKGEFLSVEERRKLLKELELDQDIQIGSNNSKRRSKSERSLIAASRASNRSPEAVNGNKHEGSGCRVCGVDDDHAKLLICEGCNGEYHIYCLTPPLKEVPKEDWFCDGCLPVDGDGLEQLVSALPPKFTSRFGEIVWAHGGVGYGWWPSCVYDPRLTIGGARQEARKNIGKKHLVYFFCCNETPFAVLDEKKVVCWENGFAEDFHMGKAAKSAGKARYHEFRKAFQAAIIEESKPTDERLEWNHQGLALLPSPVKPIHTRKGGNHTRKKRSNSSDLKSSPNMKRRLSSSQSMSPNTLHQQKVLNFSEPPHTAENSITLERNVSSEDSVLFCRVVLEKEDGTHERDIGFIKLPSRINSTFADARRAILADLIPDNLEPSMHWRFMVHQLGPVSHKQEFNLGPMFPFLGGHSCEKCDGSIHQPAILAIRRSVFSVS